MLPTEIATSGPCEERPAMKCPACFTEIDDRSYRCKSCRRVTSYRRLYWRYRFLLWLLVALIGFWTIPGLARRWFTRGYDNLADGALVSDEATLSWLGLKDR